jgi:hypothetical protein
MPNAQNVELITSRILIVRGQRVMLDADLAELYAVSTKVLNQAVKRNRARFPDDFMFQLTFDEKQEVVTKCDHLPDIIKRRLKFSKTLPYAFTEHGAIQAANVLSTAQAIALGTAPAFPAFPPSMAVKWVFMWYVLLSACVNWSRPTSSCHSAWTNWSGASITS